MCLWGGGGGKKKNPDVKAENMRKRGRLIQREAAAAGIVNDLTWGKRGETTQFPQVSLANFSYARALMYAMVQELRPSKIGTHKSSPGSFLPQFFFCLMIHSYCRRNQRKLERKKIAQVSSSSPPSPSPRTTFPGAKRSSTLGKLESFSRTPRVKTGFPRDLCLSE